MPEPQKLPRKGQVVHFYPGCDLTQESVVGVVIKEPNPDGALDLSLLMPKGGGNHIARGIRHVDSPYYRDRPQLAAKLGGWATQDEYERIEAVKRENRRAATETIVQSLRPSADTLTPQPHPDATEQKILELSNEGQDVTTICKSLKVKKDVVEAVLAKHTNPA